MHLNPIPGCKTKSPPQPGFLLFKFAVLLSGLTLALWSPGLLLSQTNGAPTDEQLRQLVRDYVARSVVLVPLKDIEIAELGPADAHGIRKVVVRLNNSQPPVTNILYITADGGEVLRGPLEELSSDPWSGTREKLAPLIAGAPAIGPADATVTVVEFGDFECPFCAQLNGELEQLRAAYPKTLRWIFRNYPLTHIHPWARTAAISGECVAQQGATVFWKFEHLIFQRQDEITPEGAVRQLRVIAVQCGAQPTAYDRCAQSPETATRVETRTADEDAFGVTATPTLFINGRRISGAISLDALKTAVDDELALISRQTADQRH